MGIDLIILVLFLASTLAIGLYASRGVTTFKDYAVGNRRMSTLVLTISLVATIYGGNNLNGCLNGYYREGLYTLIVHLASALSFYLAARYIIIRMKAFMGHFSMAESMGSVYGPTVRVVTAALCMMASIVVLSGEFKLGFNLATSPILTKGSYFKYYTIGLILIVILYSSLSGIRAVALTDVHQFFFFSICLPILVFIYLCQARDLSTNWKNFTHIPHFNLNQVFTWDERLFTALLSINHFILTFGPPHMQRVYMSASIQQAAKVVRKSAMIRVIFSLLFLSLPWRYIQEVIRFQPIKMY